MTTTAAIRKLTIQRFRGLEKFGWHPQPEMNVVLGGGDVGKTTVLEAIALLLSPSNATVVSESDYWQRDSTQEFVIEAVMTLPEATGISSQHNFCWPWAWNGQDAVAPSASEEDDLPTPDDPVYRVRVRGTTELELVWEIVQPHDDADQKGEGQVSHSNIKERVKRKERKGSGLILQHVLYYRHEQTTETGICRSALPCDFAGKPARGDLRRRGRPSALSRSAG